MLDLWDSEPLQDHPHFNKSKNTIPFTSPFATAEPVYIDRLVIDQTEKQAEYQNFVPRSERPTPIMPQVQSPSLNLELNNEPSKESNLAQAPNSFERPFDHLLSYDERALPSTKPAPKAPVVSQKIQSLKEPEPQEFEQNNVPWISEDFTLSQPNKMIELNTSKHDELISFKTTQKSRLKEMFEHAQKQEKQAFDHSETIRLEANEEGFESLNQLMSSDFMIKKLFPSQPPQKKQKQEENNNDQESEVDTSELPTEPPLPINPSWWHVNTQINTQTDESLAENEQDFIEPLGFTIAPKPLGLGRIEITPAVPKLNRHLIKRQIFDQQCQNFEPQLLISQSSLDRRQMYSEILLQSVEEQALAWYNQRALINFGESKIQISMQFESQNEYLHQPRTPQADKIEIGGWDLHQHLENEQDQNEAIMIEKTSNSRTPARGKIKRQSPRLISAKPPSSNTSSNTINHSHEHHQIQPNRSAEEPLGNDKAQLIPSDNVVISQETSEQSTQIVAADSTPQANTPRPSGHPSVKVRLWGKDHH